MAKNQKKPKAAPKQQMPMNGKQMNKNGKKGKGSK